MAKHSIQTQIQAQDILIEKMNIRGRYLGLRETENTLFIEQLQSARATLLFVQKHEAAIRAFMEDRKA